MPEGLTKIGDNAFDGCTGITRIEIPDSVEKIGAGAFDNTGLKEISVKSKNLLKGVIPFKGMTIIERG